MSYKCAEVEGSETAGTDVLRVSGQHRCFCHCQQHKVDKQLAVLAVVVCRDQLLRPGPDQMRHQQQHCRGDLMDVIVAAQTWLILSSDKSCCCYKLDQLSLVPREATSPCFQSSWNQLF